MSSAHPTDAPQSRTTTTSGENGSRFGGVGLNLRLDFIDEIVEQKPDIPFFEIIADNWFSTGPHHAKLEKIRQDYPIYFHCVGMNLGGYDKLNTAYIKKIKELAKRFEPLHISDHLCFQTHKSHSYHDLLPFPMNDDFANLIAARISFAQELVGETILVENLSYYLEFNQSTMSEPEFITEVTKRSGCKLLLDLNNIHVNQMNLGYDCREFLENYPLDRVGEIHLAGPELVDDVYVDTHGSYVADEVLAITREVGEQLLGQEAKGPVKGVPIIYERDTNLPEFGDLVGEVHSLSRSILGERS